MIRLFLQLRSLMFRSGEKRAIWLKKRNLFGSIGKDVMIQNYKLPFNPDKVFIGNNVRIAAGVSMITHKKIIFCSLLCVYNCSYKFWQYS